MRVKKINPTPAQLSSPEYQAICCIETRRKTHFNSPTVRDIAAAIGLSTSATHTLLSRLIDYGYLTRYKTSRRRIRGYKVVRSVSAS